MKTDFEFDAVFKEKMKAFANQTPGDSYMNYLYHAYDLMVLYEDYVSEFGKQNFEQAANLKADVLAKLNMYDF